MDGTTVKQLPDEAILRADVDGSAILTIHAPAYRNACSPEMREALLAHLQAALADPGCRFIVLTGAGGQFCSGGRVSPNMKPDVERTRHNVGVLQDIARLLYRGPKPAIAAVEGSAVGAGFSLAMACDYVVASEDARFCASFGKVGLMADAGLAWTLPQRIGPARARDLLLTGRQVHGAEAAALGIVDRLVSPGASLAAAIEAGARYSGIAPLSLAATKRVMGQGLASLDEVLAAEAIEQPQLTLSQDYVEGRAAFQEKRAPVFRGL